MSSITGKQFKAAVLGRNSFVDNKTFVDCNFERCNFSEYTFTSCSFQDCVFTNCNFTNAFLAENKGYDSGKFLNCTFITCNFKATSFRFPFIDNCEFRNCKLLETNFDGSRISNSKFIGELDSCFFRGYSLFAGSNSIFSFKKFDPRKLPNKMMHVDFSRAKLIGATFSHAIDLSNCVFPAGDDYIYLPDIKSTMAKVAESIRLWAEKSDRELGLKLIEHFYYCKDFREQENGFFDAFIPREIDEKEGYGCNMRVFNLIKSLNSHS